MDWDDLRVFLAVTRHGTVRGAAGALRMSMSTVSRRIDGLETALAAKVFERTSRGLRLSPVGETLLKRVDQIDSQVQGIGREVLGQDMALEGPIRLSLPGSIAQDLLMEDLAEFGRLHPKIGLAILPCFLGDKSPVLQRVSNEVVTLHSAWILTHPDLKATHRVRVFAEFLFEAIQRKAPIIKGTQADQSA